MAESVADGPIVGGSRAVASATTGSGGTPPGSLAQRTRGRARRRDLRRDVLRALSYAFIAASLGLFLMDGGATQFTSLGAGITALGTMCGLVGSALVAYMLLLVARVPIIDATLGQDKATILHETIGRGVVYALLGHALFLLTGYSISGKVDLLVTFEELWSGGGSDFIWAWAGLVLFCVVGLTSVLAFRRRAPYEAWYAIHLLSYAAVLSSLPHQFSMSGILAPGTRARNLWLLMWFLAFGAILAFRFFLPLYTTLEHGLRVTRVVPAGEDAVTIEMTGRRIGALRARGGHWFNWRFLTPGLILQPHPFSLSAAPSPTTLRFTVRNLGHGTARLMALRPGTRVWLEGPYGTLTDQARTHDAVVLVGAGIGIAPIRALLEDTEVLPDRAVVILRASTPEQLYLADQVDALCAERHIPVHHLVGSRAGQRWVPGSHAAARLTDFAPWIREADLYMCGPDPWMDALTEDARLAGVPREQIHRESFDW